MVWYRATCPPFKGIFSQDTNLGALRCQLNLSAEQTSLNFDFHPRQAMTIDDFPLDHQFWSCDRWKPNVVVQQGSLGLIMEMRIFHGWVPASSSSWKEQVGSARCRDLDATRRFKSSSNILSARNRPTVRQKLHMQPNSNSYSCTQTFRLYIRSI